MDSGSRQRQMTLKFKIEIKRNASRRRSRRKIQVTPDITKSSVDSSSSLSHVLPPSASLTALSRPSPVTPYDPSSTACVSNDHTESEAALGIRPTGDTLPTSSTPSERSSHTKYPGIRIFQQDSEISTTQDAPLPNLSLANESELTFVMTYLDYVFPISFPFYRPTILEGGRSWLLSSILRNKCLHHTVIGLTSYFFSVVTIIPGPAHQACVSHTWKALRNQTELALKNAQHELHKVNQSGVQKDILTSADLLGCIVHFLSIEVLLGSNEHWQIHLDAARSFFQQLLESYSKDEPGYAFSLVLGVIGGLSVKSPPDAPLWSSGQAAFRFFSTMLIFNDIIASTSLEQPPSLRGCYSHLLGTPLHEEPEPCLQLSDVLGCQNWILIAIGEIAVLDAWKKSMKEANQLSVAELVQRGGAINQLLHDGLAILDTSKPQHGQKRYGPVAQLGALSSYPPCAPDTINTISRIWALSARSYLLTTISGWQLANVELRTNVARTIDLLTELAPSPAWIRTLAWPICVTGCLSIAGEEILVRQLLSEMGSLRAFGTLQQALSIMEKVWRNRAYVDTETWDLAACLRCLGHRVLLV